MYYKFVLDGKVDFLDEPADYSTNLAVVMAPDTALAIAQIRIYMKYGIVKTSIHLEPENIQEATYDEYLEFMNKIME